MKYTIAFVVDLDVPDGTTGKQMAENVDSFLATSPTEEFLAGMEDWLHCTVSKSYVDDTYGKEKRRLNDAASRLALLDSKLEKLMLELTNALQGGEA